MASTTRRKSQWPPKPVVEDEDSSLARELQGALSLKMPAEDDARARGTIDQYPLMVQVKTSSSSLPHAASKQEDVLSNPISSVESKRQVIPSRFSQDATETSSDSDRQSFTRTRRRRSSRSHGHHHSHRSERTEGTLTNRGKPTERPVAQQTPLDAKRMSGSHLKSSSLRRVSVIDTMSNPSAVPPGQSSRESSVSSRHSTSKESQDPPPAASSRQTARRRSGSIRADPPIAQLQGDRLPSQRPSGYHSDPTMISAHATQGKSPQASQTGIGGNPAHGRSLAPTLVERLEEKLRQRLELRKSGASPPQTTQANVGPTISPRETRQNIRAGSGDERTRADSAGQISAHASQTKIGPPASTIDPRQKDRAGSGDERAQTRGGGQDSHNLPASAPQSPTTRRGDTADLWSKPAPPVRIVRSRVRASTVSQEPPALGSGLDGRRKSEVATTYAAAPAYGPAYHAYDVGQRAPPAESHQTQPASKQLVRRRTISSVASSPGRAHDERRSSLVQSSDTGLQLALRNPAASPTPCLLPCPRSLPSAGHEDWYTIKGLMHLNICPSCTRQVEESRFRDLFIPTLPKRPAEQVRCSFSEPWIRLAWVQTIKMQHKDLEMLHQISRGSPDCPPCRGRAVTERHWYRLPDPDTGMFLPRFHVCPACMRNIHILMPSHRDSFQREPTLQSHICDLHTDSPRFVQYIDLLDAAASRTSSFTSIQPDMSDFLAYARRKVVLRDCRRDRPILSTWHYIPHLPEFTVCEDCFDDVVWPLIKGGREGGGGPKYPLARMFTTTMRLLPGDGPARRCREASCQLYSPRMRARFREAVVVRNDFAFLEHIALRRGDAERRYRARRDELLAEAEKFGWDREREEELRRNLEEWMRWE